MMVHDQSDGRPPTRSPRDHSLEAERLRLERQKIALEYRFRRTELQQKSKKSWREILGNPLTLAVVGGFITIMTNIVSSTYTSNANSRAEQARLVESREAARQSLQADLIKKFVDGPSVANVRDNLQFLADAGLIPDYAESIKKYLEENPTAAPQVVNQATPAPTSFRRSRLNALLIGVSEYTGTAQYNLRVASKDAIDLAEFIKRQTKLYTTVNVKLLLNKEATKNGIVGALAGLASDSLSNDTTVILFATQATVCNGERVIVPSDYNSGRCGRSGLTAAEIKDLILEIRGQILVLNDTNYIGLNYIQKEGMLRPPVEEEAKFVPVGIRLPALEASVESGIAVFNAVSPDQDAIELRDNGVLTSSILRAVSGPADISMDGYISLAELADFIRQDIPLQSGGRNRPMIAMPWSVSIQPIFSVQAR